MQDKKASEDFKDRQVPKVLEDTVVIQDKTADQALQVSVIKRWHELSNLKR